MVILIVFLLTFPICAISATLPIDTCYTCHETYKGAVHGKIACTDCHRDIVKLPHGKIQRPGCTSCHSKIPPVYNKSVHSFANVQCVDCHNAHYPAKEKTSCVQCHKKVQHTTLAAAGKHVEALSCVACHGDVRKSSVDVNLAGRKGSPNSKSDVDSDRNDRIDRNEWMKFLEHARQNESNVKINYLVTADVHSMKRKAASCTACHTNRILFKKAVVRAPGAPSFEISLDPGVFIPEIPSIDQFSKTLHGRKGVKCSDCHASQAKVSDNVCINCHKKTHGVYKNTIHASSGATLCTDCHNPHNITTFKEFDARERLSVCTRCHKDYLAKHEWLPNTSLHFDYLECSTCHSPQSMKSIAFSFSYWENGKKKTVTYSEFESAFSGAKEITVLVDKDKDGSIASEELSDFFVDLKSRLKKDLFVGSALIVTKVHHDYSFKSNKERVCRTCHSEKAPFYESMYLVIPEQKGQVYLPVKGTALSALPTNLFVDLSLLGEGKVKNEDIQRVLSARGKERLVLIKELGWKWIDFFGVTLIGFVLAGIFLHILGRIIRRKK